MDKFRNKTVLITGAASGLGAAMTGQLASSGAHVFATDVDSVAIAQLRNQARANVSARILDVTSESDFSACVSDIVKQKGKLDYLINNAGIVFVGEFHDMSIHQWNEIAGVNLQGVANGTFIAYRHMVRQGSGHIVNIASLAGLVPAPGFAAYAATKHAVVGLSNSLRHEARKSGVDVTVVCPSWISTPIYQNARTPEGQRYAIADATKSALYISPERAAAEIIRGVTQRKGMIVLPAVARLIWHVTRISPTLGDAISRRILADIRARKVS